ncbi:hypothetical protein SG34_000145 [Thalassomonas viridans]|uniref:Uncharacterized protein n=1 Tax=Thalassomonas viridans TaxID=137584 RepID=A0AAF0C941_9GAMM|nr:hypothetical protein [Thalassomonas viridans]WDE05398.1 hypothetical protein SG34_000145 [Thalassomonas viridans]
MKKLTGLILLCSLFLSQPCQAFADAVYISGIKHTLTLADFQHSGEDYLANINVIGDSGQNLLFDVDAVVIGDGYQEEKEVCFTYHPDDPPCSESYIRNAFSFAVDLQVSCSGINIGMDMDNKNERLRPGERVSYTRREVKLMVSKELITGGNCRQLQVTVKGRDVANIDTIYLDVIIGEVF